MDDRAPPRVGISQQCGTALRTVVADRVRVAPGIFGDYSRHEAYGLCPQGRCARRRATRLRSRSSLVVTQLDSQSADHRGPFEQVAEIVAETLGLTIDAKCIRRVAKCIGAQAEDQEQAQGSRGPGRFLLQRVVVLSDGVHWIWEQGAEYFHLPATP